MAPAMLATSAMNGAIFDATYNMFFKLKYSLTFEAMLATPIGPRDIAVGEIAWSMVRVMVYAVGFVVLSVALGLVGSWWTVLAVPAALLSATFYPVSTYPPSWRWVVELSPLNHGVVLERALFVGDVGPGLLGHVAVLLALGAAGAVVTRRRLVTLLLR